MNVRLEIGAVLETVTVEAANRAVAKRIEHAGECDRRAKGYARFHS